MHYPRTVLSAALIGVLSLAACDGLSDSAKDPSVPEYSTGAATASVSGSPLDVTTAGHSTFTIEASGSISDAGVGSYDLSVPSLRDDRQMVIVDDEWTAPIVPSISRASLNSAGVVSAVVGGQTYTHQLDANTLDAFNTAQNKVASDKASFAPSQSRTVKPSVATVKSQLSSAGYAVATLSPSEFTATKATTIEGVTTAQTLVLDASTSAVVRTELRIDGHLVMTTTQPTSASGSRTVTLSVQQAAPTGASTVSF